MKHKLKLYCHTISHLKYYVGSLWENRHSNIAGRNAKYFTPNENLSLSGNITYALTFRSRNLVYKNLFLRCIGKKKIQKDVSTVIFVVVLLVRTKYRKQCRCPSMKDRFISWMIYPNKRNSADIKKN